MKDWGLMSVEVLLVVVGGYYVCQAMIMLSSYRCDNFDTPMYFVSSLIVGVILLGLAAVFQEIHKYRAKKRSIIIV